MFADSIILHAVAQAQSEQHDLSPRKENRMANKTQQQSDQSQSQQQMQQEASPAARKTYTDPLGRPLHQDSPRFTDQQAGGDLTGDESDARDDNFVVTGSGQNARDVSAHASALPAASIELLRSAAVAPRADPKGRPPVGEQHAAVEPQPDGTEDPGANADDGLVPRKTDGSASERH